MAEYWDVYDKNRKRTGKLHKRGIRMQPGEYNIVCEAWIVSGNRLLVTQRCKYKNFGGLWECTGGAVKAGESSIDCIKREIKEEIGIDVADAGDDALLQQTLLHGFSAFSEPIGKVIGRQVRKRFRPQFLDAAV